MWDVAAAIAIAVALTLAGMAAGALYARRQLGLYRGGNPDEIRIGAWTTNKNAGSVAATDLTRARLAINGILALDRRETVYYFSARADDGSPLDPDEDWEVVGRPFDCRWWAVTLYDEDYQLIDSPTRRYSVHSDNVVMRPDGSYCIVVSRRQQRQNWLSAGAAKRLTLTIRLYNPSDAIIRDLADISLPSIQRRLSEAA